MPAELLSIATVLWLAADGPVGSLGSLSVLVGVIGSAVATVLLVAAHRNNKNAKAAELKIEKGRQDLEGVKVSIESLERSLARADVDRERLTNELVSTRSELTETRVDLTEAQVQIAHLKELLTQRDRQHADRMKVLIRQIRRLGAVPEGDLGDDDND